MGSFLLRVLKMTLAFFGGGVVGVTFDWCIALLKPENIFCACSLGIVGMFFSFSFYKRDRIIVNHNLLFQFFLQFHFRLTPRQIQQLQQQQQRPPPQRPNPTQPPGLPDLVPPPPRNVPHQNPLNPFAPQ